MSPLTLTAARLAWHSGCTDCTFPKNLVGVMYSSCVLAVHVAKLGRSEVFCAEGREVVDIAACITTHSVVPELPYLFWVTVIVL